MTAALDTLRYGFAQRRQDAVAWRAQGGRVAGYAGQGFPDALAIACDYLPYRLSGDPQTIPAVLDELLYPVFNKAQSIRGMIRREQPLSMLAEILSGSYAFIDRLFVVNGRRDMSLLLTHLRAALRARPSLDLPETAFLDRATETGYAASQFARDCIATLTAALDPSHALQQDAGPLHAAIGTCNANIAALHGISALRLRGMLTSADGLAAIGASWFMPKQEHTRLLLALSGELGGAQPRAGPRLVLVGGAIDHAHLHGFVDTLGATIVLDWHEWGEAAIPPPLSGAMAPLEAVAAQFHAQAPGFATPLAVSAVQLARQAGASGADGAIILGNTGDDLMIFDAADYQAAFEAEGLPVLRLHGQPYGAPDQQACRAITEFCGGIPARAVL